MKTKTVKVITTLIAVSAIAVISGVSYIAYTYNEKLDTIKGIIEEQVTVDLQDYFTEYVNQSTMESGILENTVDNLQQNTNKIYLSKDQVNAIVDSVVNQVTPDLLKQIVSTNQTITLKSIEALEKEIDEKLQSIIPENTLSESEMKELADMVSLIVESNILKEYSKAEDMTVDLEELEILKNSIINKLKQINLAIDTYENKVVDLEKELKNLKNEGASVDELIALEERITSAYRSLENFAVKSSKAIIIVDDLMTEYDVEGGVVSAEDGHGLLMRLQELNNKLSVTAISLSENMENLQHEIAALNENMVDNSSEISNLKNKNTELNGLITSTNSSLQALEAATDVNCATTAVSQAIAAAELSANTTAAANLQNVKTEIEQAYASGDTAAINTATQNAKELISLLNTDLSGKITANELKITNLNTTVTNMQNQISTKASQQDLIDLKDGLDNGAKTTYSFSGSGSNATVTITVPAS